MIEVDIYEAGKHFLKGRPVEDSKPFTPSITAPLQKGEVSGLMQVNRQAHTLARQHVWMHTTAHTVVVSQLVVTTPQLTAIILTNAHSSTFYTLNTTELHYKL